MPDTLDPAKAAALVVRRRLIRRWRGDSRWRRRIPSALVAMFVRGLRRRPGWDERRPTAPRRTIVVTVRIGDRPCSALDVRRDGVDHVCFTDRPEGLPGHWHLRPIEYWAANDRLTTAWIERHLPQLFDTDSEIVWVDPETIDDETSTGSRRWFGDQTVGRRGRRATSTRRSDDVVGPAAVVVPVHDAPDDVERCLASVVGTMRAVDRLVIVDDGSAPETAAICQRFARLDRVSLIRRESGSGFPAAANAGLERCSEQFVVVLNSDTVVPSGWITTLLAHLVSHPDAAAVGPLSNAARFQSIPFLGRGADVRNALPNGIDIEWLNEFLRHWSDGIGPIRVPLLNGFCIGFRRSALDRIGLFDAVSFPRGFGEENDWCQRATEAGHSLVVAPDVYVAHAKGRSYPVHEVDELKRRAAQVLADRYGTDVLDQNLTAMRYPAALVALRADTQALWAEMERPRI